MQFIKKTSSRTNFLSLIIKLALASLFIIGIVFILNKIDFPAPIKEIEKKFLMKNLRLLSKKSFTIILASFLSFASLAEDTPVDIWDIDKQEKEISSSSQNVIDTESGQKTIISESDIYKMQSQKKNNSIKLDEYPSSDEIKIFGLYDPEDYGLGIDMWSNSDGDNLKNIFAKINKIDLSPDASEIMRVSMLTNAYFPRRNISEKDFLKFRSDWLIKNSDLNLIEEYLTKNQIIDIHPTLTKYLIDQHLSEANVNKACRIFSKNMKPLDDEYLTKFNIYCLINSGKNDEAQLFFDLKKELGFNDKYFEKKINYLLGYTSKVESTISENQFLIFIWLLKQIQILLLSQKNLPKK